MIGDLVGKVAIVTGATKGIGRGIARVLAKAGASTAVLGRSETDGQRVVEEIRALNGKAMFVAADVTDKASLELAVTKVFEAWGGVDILCANAGIFPSASLEEMQSEDFDLVMNTNVKSTLFSVQACLPYLKASDQGRVIVTSSITGPITGFPGWAHYGASKSAQLGFIRTACIELAKYKITMNAILPGNIMTEGLADLGQEYLDGMAASIPLNALGDVEDIGNAALFFASEEAKYITGQTLVVDGGQVLPESLEALG